MPIATSSIVSNEAERMGADLRARWVIETGQRYWPADGGERIAAISLPRVDWQASGLCRFVALPPWAADLGVGTPPTLLVDAATIVAGSGSDFERCNWVAAAFLFLSGAEEKRERVNSYAVLMKDVDTRIFERAWVNRIFLLLRRIAAHQVGTPEAELFGPMPCATIDLTHDVDAVRKTPEIRFKQTTFHAFNSLRSAARGNWRSASKKIVSAACFVASTPSYWTFERVRTLECRFGVRSTFHLYGGPPGWRRVSPRRMLFDPAYDVRTPDLRRELVALLEGGWSIGVHPSFDSCESLEMLAQEKRMVELACGTTVTRCRQHWLRFSWARTWEAQAEAGFELDTTLGFNDRPGLRNGAALRFAPWSNAHSRPLAIAAMPMVFMDSHFYDYEWLDSDARRRAMAYWLNEIRAVGGEASVNWHTHTLADDYGWSEGYLDLLQLLS